MCHAFHGFSMFIPEASRAFAEIGSWVNAQQQWPYQNLAFLSNIIRGLPVNSNQQTVGLAPATSSAYSPSPLASFLGTAVGAKGLGFRAGGEVAPRRRRGGK